MKNWILILALLSLHGCKVFNTGSTVTRESYLSLHADAGFTDASDDSENKFKALFFLNAITGEEEYNFFLLPSGSFIQLVLNPFLFKEGFPSALKNLSHHWRVPLYLSFKKLIV